MRLIGLVVLTAGCGSCLLQCTPAAVRPPLPGEPAPAGSHEDLVKQRDEFLRIVEEAGIELPYRPEMREWTRKSLISFREEARAVAVPRYQDLDAKVKAFLEPLGGEELFHWTFRWFFPAHELTHFLQNELGWSGDHAVSERFANDGAVAFLRGQPNGEKNLRQFQILVERAVAALPDPTPAGKDSDRYFDEHYHELGQNPGVYGAYQWRFVNDSLRRREQLDFPQLIRELLAGCLLPTAVMLDPELDAGFHVAAHLDVPGLKLSVFDPLYTDQVRAARELTGIPDMLLGIEAPRLSRKLTPAWRVHQLVRVPALFPGFADTKAAFRLLLGEEQPGPANQRVHKRLRSFLLSQTPELLALSDSEREIGRLLASVIEYEYESFLIGFHRLFREKWDWARRTFRQAWYREIAPALIALDPARQVREVVIVLSPALRRHGKSYRIQSGIGRVATLLPETPAEMDRALLWAFHELCHGITDPLVYQLGYRRDQVTYVRGDKGEDLQALLEMAANLAMFTSLGRTNPRLQERFLQTLGDLSFLADSDKLAERIRCARRDISAETLGRLKADLLARPLPASREIWEGSLLVPEAVTRRMQDLLEQKPGGR